MHVQYASWACPLALAFPSPFVYGTYSWLYLFEPHSQEVKAVSIGQLTRCGKKAAIVGFDSGFETF